MKSSEEVKKMIVEREKQLSNLHNIASSMDARTLERFPWLAKRVAEIINELVLLQEIYNG